MTLHHIIFDAVSINQVFLPELYTLYQAFAQGKAMSLYPLPLQYADFSAWERETLRKETFSQQLAYWKQQLAGAPQVLDLPVDRPRPALQSYRGSMQVFALPLDVSEALKALSLQEHVTLYMLLAAAFQVLLQRYTGQDDLLLGTITSSRKASEVQHVVGYFLNTLVLRTDLSGNPTFLELLRRVKNVILSARQHEDIPFDVIVKELQPEQSLSYQPLVQVILAFQPQLPILPAGWTASQTNLQTHISKFDLSLELDDRPEGLTGRFIYNADLFDASTISRTIGHWQTLLEGVSVNPAQHLAELPLLTEEEEHLLKAALSPAIQAVSREPFRRPLSTFPQLQGEGMAGEVVAMPMSLTQQGLWLVNQLEVDRATSNMPVGVRLRGLLDVRALERSLNAIVQRHEALRTTFTMRDGQPLQVIAPTLTVALPAVDLRDFPQPERETEALRLGTEEAQRPFNLTQGPLMRATLLWLKEDEHILLLTLHQIVCDDWSTSVFIRELARLYESFSLGKPSSLPDLPIQYADYVCWQRERLQGEVRAAMHSYWKLQLSGAPAILQLPSDRPRSAARTFERAHQSLVVPKTLTEALQALSRQEGATLFMTLLAAFQILLQRYTGQEDLVVGSLVSDRTRAEVESLVGCFVNPLALRTNLSGNPSFRELLARVREVILGAYAHVDLPCEQLAEELQPDGNLNHPPTFDVMINFVNTPHMALELPGLTLSSLQMVKPAAKSALTLDVETDGSELSLRLVYQRALFLPERIDRMLHQLQYLLEQIAAVPEKPIQSYSLVAPESVPLLPDPLAVLPEPPYELITQTFAFWAKQAREQPAVCQGLETWTYGELAESSHVLAQFLLAHRLEPGDVVAVLGQQSFGLIASMIAVLLAGEVLLPIDWNLPAHRQQLMLREAGAKHLLYVGNWRPEDTWIQELPSLAILRVDPAKGQPVEPKNLDGAAAQLPVLNPDAAAYIFFTSGTTGIPKGVLGCQKGLSHFLNWQRKTFAVEPHDRCAQLTNLSFDVVLRDIFLPLTSGATLCLPKESDILGPDRILHWLERERISLLHTVPTLAQSWLSSIPPEVSLQTLRWVFLAGEPLTDGLVKRWREAFPKANGIVNLYGPTETTLAKCFYIVPPHVLPGVQPAGWPQPETQALLLTANNQLCGIGEPGEIVIRTPFRTMGYINAPEENRKRFIKNPFRDDEGDLLYRTGDRGRYGLDGSLEILGRMDHQVKIRGVRVEPDEIMTILQQHPAVRTCAVVAQNNEQGQNMLVAYIVIEKQERVTSSELRSFLSGYLPPPMVPSAFVLLEALPLLPNGKVDRRALPTLDQVKLALEETFVAPRTAIEEILVGIWAEIFGLERVGIHDDFFALGGQSLLAMQVTSRLRSILQVEVPLRSFFEAPTVAQLAEAITQLKASGAIVHKSALDARSREANRVPMSSALPVQEGALVREISKGKDETTSTSIVSHQSLDQDLYMLPASFAQQRLWFLDQLEPQSAVYKRPSDMRVRDFDQLLVIDPRLDAMFPPLDVLYNDYVGVFTWMVLIEI